MNKKTAGILTFHDSPNYGAILQAYALSCYLNEVGLNCKIIDYQNAKRKYSQVQGIKKIRSIIWSKTIKRFFKNKERVKRTREFKKQYFPLTDKTYHTFQELKDSKEIFDYYIVGSDQVWNEKNNCKDLSYFLDFVNQDKTKISYAPSFGTAKISDAYTNIIKDSLNKFDYISIREESGKQIIKDVCNKEAITVCDPVFLLDKQKWQGIAKCEEKEKYILCYYMPGDKLIENNIDMISKALKKKTGFKIINIGKKEYAKILFSHSDRFDYGPQEFVGAIRNAEYVITNSFHGTAFSILFDKKLIVPYRKDLAQEKRLNTRITELLKRIKKERSLFDCHNDDLETLLSSIDKKSDNNELESFIKQSKEFLAEALGVQVNKKGENMLEICSTDKCYGCSACAITCPRDAIVMIENIEGFLYPSIDNNKCVDCGLCSMNCPANKEVVKNPVGNVFAFISKDKVQIQNSASGGAFYELAKKILQKNGIVYGVKYDNHLKAIHSRVDNINDIRPLLSTKYVQSNLNDIFIKVKKDLEEKKEVLFSGTGCQIFALNTFLEKKYDNLYTVDLLCKGVPSPGLFRKYIDYLEKKNKYIIKEINFRSKIHGWGYLVTTIKTTSGKQNELKGIENTFIKTSGRGYVRKNCFCCPFTSKERVSDLTIGDFWGIGKRKKINFDISKGVSAVICNTSKGTKLLNSIDTAFIVEREMDELLNGQSSSLSHPIKEPSERKQFFIDNLTLNYEDLAKKYLLEKSIKSRIKEILPIPFRRLFKKVVKNDA